MKEEQNRPKIKVKIRKIENDNSQTLSNDTIAQHNEIDVNNTESSQNMNTEPIKKIKIHHSEQDNSEASINLSIPKSEKSEENGKNSSNKRSFFHITTIILTILLAIAIVVEVAVMIWLNINTEDLKHKNDKLPNEEMSISIHI